MPLRLASLLGLLPFLCGAATAHDRLASPEHASEALAVDPLFSDQMVLQSYVEGDARSFVYGTAAPGSVVLATVSRLPCDRCVHVCVACFYPGPSSSVFAVAEAARLPGALLR